MDPQTKLAIVPAAERHHVHSIPLILLLLLLLRAFSLCLEWFALLVVAGISAVVDDFD